MFSEIAALVVVAALWGSTNPLIKRNTKDIMKIKGNTPLVQLSREIKYLFTNYQYLIPMGLNQIGSIIYFVTLQNVDMSLSVPVANSLTFIFTAIAGWFVGESLPNKRMVLGIAFVLLGTTLCCYDKYVKPDNVSPN